MTTAVTTLTQLPQRVDLHLYAGDTFSMVVRISQGGAPLDVSGEAFAASMDDGNAFTIDTANAAAGELTLSIVPGPFARRYDLEMTSKGQTLLAGRVCADEEVTP